jgi:uncharacterized membrane protein YeaQ/YmgE (transglycosylase-associated protein family)
MISIYALTERLAPARVVITMTVLAAGGPIGTAIGQTVAGTFTTDGAPLAGVQLTPIIAGIAVLLTLATRLLDANRYHRA